VKFNQFVHSNEPKLLYNLTIITISLLYAYLLVSVIPSSELIKDRMNYLGYVKDSSFIVLKYFSADPVSLFFNEPVWLGLNIGLSFLLTAEQTVAVFIFFSASVTSYLILKVNPKAFLFLFCLLLFPQIITKFVVHLRQGLAITIFLMAWFSVSKSWRWFLFALTPLIHASFFFVLFLIFYVSILKKLKFAVDLRTIAIVILGLVIVIGLEFIVSALGARQAKQYEYSATEVSGLGFLYWLAVFILYWLQGHSFTRENTFAMAAIAFYLTTYFLIEVTGRIFESTVIIVLLASLGLTSWRRKMFIGLIGSFVLLSWLMRLNQPWLGWGTGL
jgi:hypothetical protein